MDKAKHRKIAALLAGFKYVTRSIESRENYYTIHVPTTSGKGVRPVSVFGLKKAIAVRNKIGKRIWGEYWPAVLSGYIDTIKSPTASVNVNRSLDKRSGNYDWIISHKGLRDNKTSAKSFAENKYGASQAESLARSYAALLTESRLEQLREWKPRWIRRPQENPGSPYRNRGTLATK